MKKKTKSKSSNRIFSKTDTFSFTLGIILSLLFIVYGLYKFQSVFFSSLNKMNEEPVATVSDTIKLTRRCFEKRTLWDVLKKGSLIYNGDTIRTDKNSQTTICFYQDGLELTLTSDTMTRISMGKNNRLEVSLSTGNILVDSIKKDVVAKIIYNNTSVSVQGKAMFSAAEVEVSNDGSGSKKLEVHVLEGKVDVEAKGTEKVVVQNGQMVTVSVEDKKDDVISSPAQIENNINSHEFVLQPQELPYSAEGKEAQLTGSLFSEAFRIASGSPSLNEKLDFQDVKKAENIKAEEGYVAKILHHFLSEGESEKSVEIQAVKMVLPAISNMKPASGKVFNDEYFLNNPSISFSWAKVPGATHYEFSLYKSNGKLIEKQTSIKKNGYVFKNLEKLSNGKFTWKVRAVNSSGPVSQEKQASFTIKLGKISGDASTTETNYKVRK